MKLFTLSFILIKTVLCYQITTHPLSDKIAYVRNVDNLNSATLKNLKKDFAKHPMLIFKNAGELSPTNFLKFASLFDEYADKRVIENPLLYPTKMLQPFDQIPEVPNVAPRGWCTLKNYHNIENLDLEPYEPFKKNYIWHTDMLGHDFKTPNVVTGFHIIKQPLIGGNTDFICGETVYEHLTDEEKVACENMLLCINRRKFITNDMEQNKAGTSRIEDFKKAKYGNEKIPLLFHNDESDIPSVLLLPTFFEKVDGWNVKDSRKWLQKFMEEKVLPHRISIQWVTGDVAIFNNRRFMHSAEPAESYMKHDYERLLLQTFIPTKKPLKGITPSEKNVYACYEVEWNKDIETSIISAHRMISYANTTNSSVFTIV
jgi:alpha-ketoglutarate-dependent taurine dioxygenase